MSIACVNGTRIKGAFNMDDLEIYWLCEVFLICIVFSKVSDRNKKIIMAVIISTPRFSGPLVTMLAYALMILTGSLSDIPTRFLFNTCLTPIYSGHKLPEKPTIIMCNYPANYIEYLCNKLLHPIQNKGICFVILKAAVVQSRIVKLFYPDNCILFIAKGGSFQHTLDLIKRKISQGYSIFTYIEKDYYKRRDKYSISKLRSGMFTIAKTIGVTITPVVFDHIDHYAGLITQDTFRIHIGSTRLVKDVAEEVELVRQLFTKKLRLFKIK